MKMKTLLMTAVLAISGLALTAPAVAQSSATLHLSTTLNGAAISDGSGSADFIIAKSTPAPSAVAKSKVVTKFSVVVESVTAANNNILDVFVGPATSTNEPFGKFVGRIHLEGGAGALLQVDAKTPAIRQGSTVTVVDHAGATAEGRVVLQGTF